MKKNNSSLEFSQGKPSLYDRGKLVPISVNLPVTSKCNYRCRFCFAKGCLGDDSRILEIPSILADAGTQKMSFEGGEPLLYPKLNDLLKVSKEEGLVTSVISNGSLITKDNLSEMSEYLDWLTLSVDSNNEKTERKLGRGFGDHVKQIRKVASWANDLGIKLKLNTVVTKLNIDENLSDFYLSLKPKRIKLFQVLPIDGTNTSNIQDLLISEKEFNQFVERHLPIKKKGIPVIHETNDDMIGSYIMILRDGRIFNNTDHRHHSSTHTIFEDIEKALEEAKWDVDKFEKRGGLYEW